jgi:hypothetical protein
LRISLKPEERKEFLNWTTLFIWLFGPDLILILPPPLKPLQAGELIPRSGGILLDAPVQEGAVAFFPREAALARGAFLVAKLGSASA